MYGFCQTCRITNILIRKSYFSLCQPAYLYSKQIVLSVHTSYQLFDVNTSQKTNVLVYKAPLSTRIKYVKFLSLTSSLLGFAVLPIFLKDLAQTSVFAAVAAGTVSTVFLSTPLMLHWITKRYVLELHYNDESKEFTAKTYNIISQIKEIKFKADDVIVPDLPGMLTSFCAKGKPLFVDANMVQDPDAYSHMMGYDKPFDIAIKSNNKNEDTKPS